MIAVDAETAGPETTGFWQLAPGLAQVVDAVRDADEREYLSGLTSTLNLGKEAVNRLRRNAAKILDDSAEFERFLKDVEADSMRLDSFIEPGAIR